MSFSRASTNALKQVLKSTASRQVARRSYSLLSGAAPRAAIATRLGVS